MLVLWPACCNKPRKMTEPTTATVAAVTEAHVARGVGTTLLARLGAVVEIVAQPLYVLMFGLAGYGLYAVLWAAVNLAENVFDLGMTSALQRTVPQAASAAEEVAALRTALLWGVGPCLVVAAFASAMAEPLAGLVNVAAVDVDRVAPAIAIFAWALPLWALVEIATSALRAKALFGPEIRLRIFWEQIIRLVLAAALWAAGMGVTGLFIAHLASLAITALLTMRLVARHYPLNLMGEKQSALTKHPSLDTNGGQDISRLTLFAGLSVLPGNIVARLFGDAPALLLNALLPGAEGARAAALFVIARKLSSVVQLVRTAFVYVLAPLASAAEAQDRAQVRAVYGFAVRLIVAIALPLGAVLAAGHAPLLALFGGEARVAASALVILIAARAAEAIFGIATPVLQVVGRFRDQLTASLIGLIAALLAIQPLIERLGALTGVTAAMALGLVIAAIVPMLQLWRGQALHPVDGALGRAAAVSAGLAAIAAPAALALNHLPDAAALPLLLALALAAMWASLRFALPVSDRAALGGLGRRLRLA
jgi:O-antigen/teichoic acid export membrane protein